MSCTANPQRTFFNLPDAQTERPYTWVRPSSTRGWVHRQHVGGCSLSTSDWVGVHRPQMMGVFTINTWVYSFSPFLSSSHLLTFSLSHLLTFSPSHLQTSLSHLKLKHLFVFEKGGDAWPCVPASYQGYALPLWRQGLAYCYLAAVNNVNASGESLQLVALNALGEECAVYGVNVNLGYVASLCVVDACGCRVNSVGQRCS